MTHNQKPALPGFDCRVRHAMRVIAHILVLAVLMLVTAWHYSLLSARVFSVVGFVVATVATAASVFVCYKVWNEVRSRGHGIGYSFVIALLYFSLNVIGLYLWSRSPSGATRGGTD
jgi:hypothetical protein